MKNHGGTAARCSCCESVIVSTMHPDIGMMVVSKRKHGTTHRREFSLTDIVMALDPEGTSFSPVGLFV
jgi:hypothetical protein